MATTQNTTDETSTFNGLYVRFYPPELSESELYDLIYWAGVCVSSQPASHALSRYLLAVARLEGDRRESLEAGSPIVEVSMVPLPTHTWTNQQLVAAMTKCGAIAQATDGEVGRLFGQLQTVINVEAMHRLDPNSGHTK